MAGSGGSRMAARAGGISKKRGIMNQRQGWVMVRGLRIRRAGLRFNAQGEVFVPDSEDESERIEDDDAVGGDEGAAKVAAAGVVGAVEVAVAGVDGDAEVAATGVEGDAEDPDDDDDEIPNYNIGADMDPPFREFFISMFKIYVPSAFWSKKKIEAFLMSKGQGIIFQFQGLVFH